ncbi:PREDICTED: lipopolysaccharide-responsive and beige-like anchor protein [Amphimedon queenslandica]|uniref:BEACH domain-containing protein n=1 Tax=Amphimedon queenslandica TaxID=400682 RepID=A0AAN0JG85_AMPQE|nr:PREDICTED: lipopolysaccharide-responsive and beige-like anchor protein [Amphimedon queenslandica]|eukprot:XP_019855658.1 PREDICTED: lipopolysaccharide-responsive and beige-like anchor protein [Amphimedon queenslandica]
MKQQSKTLLKSVGMTDTSLDKYVAGSLENKLVSLKDCQLLLNTININRIQRVIPRELESRSLLQPILSSIFYFLSVLCVAKYKSILDSVEKERADLSLPRRQRSSTSSNGSQSPQLSLELGSLPLEDPSSPPPPLTPDTLRFSRSDSFGSSVASASDLKEVPPGEKPMQFFGAEGVLHPPTTVPLNQAVDVSEQVSVSLRLAGGCLCQVLVDHKSVLSKVLTTVDGRNLLSDAALKLAEANSTVEITMLLCSQEWQTSLQKTAAKYFASLITEGRHITHISESFIRTLAMNVSQSIKSNQEISTNIFTKYEEGLSLFISDIIKDTLVDRKMKKAELLRHAQTAEALWRKLSPMVDNCGSFDFTLFKITRHSLLWRLDLKEDSHRRRLKTLPNHNGSTHSNAVRSNPEQLAMEDKSSFDPNLLLSPLPTDEDRLTDERVGEEEGDIIVENKETPQVSLDCSMIFLSYVLPGTLSFTKQHFTFTADDSSTEYNKVSQICDYCPLSDQWLLASVTAVFSRYYIHQFKALEIFFNDKSSIFIVLKSPSDRKTVINLLPKVGIGPNYGLPQTRSVSLSPPRQLFKRSDMTDKWIKSEISNFDYLMFLNTVAGRSFNDLSQYPVFPWILSDYKSKTIDLKDSAIYRDLSKPIGCLNPSRLDQYLERYEMWESDSIPSFHYGTHYSTMAFVVHWLVRVEPFTSIHIDLHDGFFDHGSRLFSSIARAWNNCQVDSSDVKELIPELFYLPEMLQNNNKFVLGFDEHGEFGEELPEGQLNVVNDVLLPPWAENAEKFIEIHRQALESDYVSANLHQWVDLIFGYKQNGPEAIKSTNVFYHITYPGSVNWQAITDEYQLKALEQQVLQFGQTPHQLLLEPHLQKHLAIKEFPPQPKSKFNPAIVAEVNVSLDVPIGCLHLSSTHSLIAITYNQLFGIYKWNYTQGTISQPPQISLEHDQSNTASLKVRLGDPLDQSVSFSSSCFDVTPAGDYILSCGFWDSSFKVFSTETGLSVQSVFAHRGIVSCISFSPEEGLHSLAGDALVATGSHDVTVLLWRWSGRYNRIVNQLGTSTQSSVNPIAILNGHEKTITCVAVSASHGLVASGAKHGCCLIHSTNGELLHKLVPSNPWTHPHIIKSSPQGHFIVHYADQKGCLAVFSCNGKQLCYKGLGEPALAVSVSNDGQYLVIGGFSSRVYVLLLDSLSVVHAYDKNESSIRSLHMSKDNRFIFIGHSSGVVSVFATHFWRT